MHNLTISGVRMPSFRRGFARTLDVDAVIRHVSYDRASSAAEADRDAIARDWKAVGADLRHAMDGASSRGGEG